MKKDTRPRPYNRNGIHAYCDELPDAMICGKPLPASRRVFISSDYGYRLMVSSSDMPYFAAWMERANEWCKEGER